MLPLQGVWVQSLVGEVGSRMTCSTAKKKKKSLVVLVQTNSAIVDKQRHISRPFFPSSVKQVGTKDHSNSKGVFNIILLFSALWVFLILN